MYKIFINQTLVCFQDQNFANDNKQVMNFNKFDVQFVLDQLNTNHATNVVVICENLQEQWLTFLSFFDVIEAAGGVVFNKQEELLWIKRFGMWDLPKGHIEKNEDKKYAALREVEEECNLSNLSIEKELDTTYHVYLYKGSLVLKKTYWFLMHTKHESYVLKPQLEEDITEVCFLDKEVSKKYLKDTYGNIQVLLNPILL